MGALARWIGLRSEARGGEPRTVATGCLCCGRCCESFGGHLNASRADLERWRRLGRADLVARVSAIGWIWIDPERGVLEDRCPFLRWTGPDSAVCDIHEIKPDMCRDYPTLAHERRCLRGVFLGWAAALASLGELLEPAMMLAA